MKKTINAVARTVTFTFDGDLAPVIVHADRLSAAMQDYAVLHSIGHRVGDNAAIPKTFDNGFRITEAMKRAAVVEMADHMQSGTEDWDMKTRTRAAPLNPTWLKLAQARGVEYSIIAAEKAEADIAELAALTQ